MKMSKIFLTMILGLVFAGNVRAQFGLGADVVSRYVWRGTDFGNSASVQPALSYTAGSLEIGAWGSFALTDGGANENDLYMTYSVGNFGITLTDYYFPVPGQMEAFNYADADGFHWLEASASFAAGDFSVLVGMFFSGDPDNSMYVELGYGFYEKDDVSASLTVAAGNGVYLYESEDLNLVNVGLAVAGGPVTVSYIVNPQAETNFLVFGYSF
ncbi:hypothetical protein JW948_13825 [bacterium]|nr:hypothetical protein [bacterium]